MTTAALAAAWDDLRGHQAQMKDRHMRDLFAEDPERFARFSLRLDDLLLDYSKNRIVPETMEKLLALAEAAGIESARDAMFAGEKINLTEGRAVLHTALRNRSDRAVMADGRDVMGDVRAVLGAMAEFANGIRDGSIAPAGGGRFTDVVNIGIGAMLCHEIDQGRADDNHVGHGGNHAALGAARIGQHGIVGQGILQLAEHRGHRPQR
ncbi:MAG TPA: hypothetical protein EYP07_00415, partial [Kiloniellaceae bacterium]|nr:hypothetical protein [Kiloniellaceae bacterium]